MSLQSSRCAFSTAAALHRVFIAPIELSQLGPRPHQARQKLSLRISPKLYPGTQHHCYVSGAAAKRRLPRNKEISSQLVHIVSADGKLSTPQSTWHILNQIDAATHSLITVAAAADQPTPTYEEYSELDTSAPNKAGPEFPICKIVVNKELWELEKSKTRKTKSPTTTVKTIELNWAIDDNDLKHRLGRIRHFLEKGYRVEVMMAGKRKGKKATQQQAEELVKSVKGVIEDVPGAKEMKTMDGKVLDQATIYFEGKVQK